MKTRFLITLILVIIALTVAITYIVLSFNQTSDTSFYYGDIRISENDKLCFVTLTIHNATLTSAEMVKNVRQEISKLGSQYDFEERRITAEQINKDTISIEIGGSWRTIDSDDRPNLLNLVSNRWDGIVGDRFTITCA